MAWSFCDSWSSFLLKWIDLLYVSYLQRPLYRRTTNMLMLVTDNFSQVSKIIVREILPAHVFGLWFTECV